MSVGEIIPPHNCSNCAARHVDVSRKNGTGDAPLVCRRQSPKVVHAAVPVQSLSGSQRVQFVYNTVWPDVMPDFWCCEWLGERP